MITQNWEKVVHGRTNELKRELWEKFYGQQSSGDLAVNRFNIDTGQSSEAYVERHTLWKIDECNLTKIDWIIWPERWNWKFYFDSFARLSWTAAAAAATHPRMCTQTCDEGEMWKCETPVVCLGGMDRGEMRETAKKERECVANGSPKIYCDFELGRASATVRIFDLPSDLPSSDGFGALRWCR